MSSRIDSVFLGGEQEVFLGREVGLCERQNYSERTAMLIDEEVQQLISERTMAVRQLLSQNQEALDQLARALLEQESLDEQQIHRLIMSSLRTGREAVGESNVDGSHFLQDKAFSRKGG